VVSTFGRAMAGMRPGIRTLCLAYDVEHYSGRGTRREYATQQRLSDVLEFALGEAGVKSGGLEIQEQGDGGIALLPTGGSIDEPRLIVGLLTALVEGLAELNEDLMEHARVRLRVALHEGVVHRAPHGYVGPAVIEVCRLRDADVVRSALASGDAPMVAIVSDGLYRDVLSQGYHGLPRSVFSSVEVRVKSFSGKAWIYLPGALAPAGGHSGDLDMLPVVNPEQALAEPVSGRVPLEDFLATPPEAW
jgi:hypothetical protein